MPKSGFTMKVEGLQDLEKALKELPRATGKNVIKRSLITAAQLFVDTAQALIKVRRVYPAIVKSKLKVSSGDAGKRAFAAALARGATREEAGEEAHEANAAAAGDEKITSGQIVVGPTTRAFYGFEFGTYQQAPQPFMRPSWDTNKEKAVDTIKEAIKDEIDKAAARLAKKALKAKTK